jgi:uncharacterized NAD(P)/FAD-binding protein YdhS
MPFPSYDVITIGIGPTGIVKALELIKSSCCSKR